MLPADSISASTVFFIRVSVTNVEKVLGGSISEGGLLTFFSGAILTTTFGLFV
jgi:hypothetical protein